MLEELRKVVWKANLDLPRFRLVAATSGNVSGLSPDGKLVVIKPSGYDYDELKPEHLVIVDLEGNVVEGDLKPSVDTATHLYVYRHMPHVRGIVHTHSPYATSFAVRGESLPVCMTTLAMEFGGPIPVSDFAVIGGEAIGEEIVTKIGRCPAILMRNHGVFTIGDSVRAAVKAAVMIEEAAQTVHYALVRGGVQELPADVIRDAYQFYQTHYGQ